MHLDARLEVVPSRGAVGESMDLVIRNTGSTVLLAGRQYAIERYDGDDWIQVRWPSNNMWTLEAHSISPGSAWTQCTRVPAHLSPGAFRAIKTLEADADDSAEEITVSGAFEVVEHR
jgi:hypothetical protein